MSLDFALKDFYRKRKQTIPYVSTIALIITLAIFLIHFSTSFNLNTFIVQEGVYANLYFFSGAVNYTYSQFNIIILVLILIFAVLIISVITSSFINSKKKDISIMKALGTLPEKLYNFYITESFIIFFIGFIIGYLLGLFIYTIFLIAIDFTKITVFFQFDFIFSTILFLLCFSSMFSISWFKLKRIGKKNVIKSFSNDIEYDYCALEKHTLIPKWLSSLGFNLKFTISNIIRKKNKFLHYFITFFIISLLIFTLGLSALVLNNSSKMWVEKSQGENIIVIGHNDVLKQYSSMYEMYSNPNTFIDKNDIQFTNESYLFNWSQIDEIGDIPEIKKIDQRLIEFCDIKEETVTITTPPNEVNPQGSTQTYGQHRSGNFPIIGINSSNIIQDFEIEGRFFTQDDAHLNLTISDGLAYNYFDFALVQDISFPNLDNRFGISGIVIDSFYSGHNAYIDIIEFRDMLNISENSVNIILLKIKNKSYSLIKDQIEMILINNLGNDFKSMDLANVFNENLNFINTLSSYSLILIILTSIVSLFSFYDLQKGDLSEKLRDLIIMRSIGSKIQNIRKILFFEGLFTIVPAVLSSLAGGMIINSLFLSDRVYLPSLDVPFMLIGLILLLFIILNYFILIPILKRIKNVSFRDIISF